MRLYSIGLSGFLASVLVLALTFSAAAQDEAPRPTLNFYGVTGLIDMPSGESARDGNVSIGFSKFGGIGRYTLSFQFTPRLSGSFRYAGIDDCTCFGFETYYDRSFDLRYKVLNEGRYLPAVTIGLQDFIGTGVSAAEYVVATKSLGPKVKVTAGIGWGRLGSYNSIGSPFGKRPRNKAGDEGGTPNYDVWFRGPAAPFAGIEWQVNDRLGLKLEYSSDIYKLEDEKEGVLDRRSPFNFGLEYQATPGMRIGAYYLYGSEIGLNAQFVLDPNKRTRNRGIQGPAPLPVAVRPSRTSAPEAWSQDWALSTDRATALRPLLERALALDGMSLESMALSGDRVQIRVRNKKYDSEAQAIGHVARLLTQTMPASVEVFEIVPVVDGLPTSKITLRRRDVEELELAPNGSAALFARADVSDPGPRPDGLVFFEGAYPKFTWSLGPYSRLSLFDPRQPVRIDIGARLSAKYEIAPGLVLSGSLTKKLIGNLDGARRSNSVLPHVRSDAAKYNAEEGVALEALTLAWYTRAGQNLYGRVTVGYLERMFGGVSTEVLWKPVDGNLGIGAELNYVAQRNFDQGLGFQDYKVFTGHLSAYYELGKGYLAQIDVGRYLAGDVGATFSLDREFANGWRVGAFATLTDVSAEDFGEGSFDKGIRITVPLTWLTGEPSRKLYSTTVRPLTRDGGARLFVAGRLYETVRSYHTNGLDAQWGRVFR